jgi:hypothetical protein
MPAVPLVGRDRESGVVSGMLEGLPERGGGLVVRGEAASGSRLCWRMRANSPSIAGRWS